MATRLAVGIQEPPKRRGSWTSGRPMTGADQFVARRPGVVAWLAKCLAEMRHKSREWPFLDERRLEAFLRRAGVDVDAALKAHEDALPVPEQLSTIGDCIGAIRNASFLTRSAESACALVRKRHVESLHRR